MTNIHDVMETPYYMGTPFHMDLFLLVQLGPNIHLSPRCGWPSTEMLSCFEIHYVREKPLSLDKGIQWRIKKLQRRGANPKGAGTNLS